MKQFYTYNIPIHLVGWTVFFFAPLLLSPGSDFTETFQNTQVLFPTLARNFVLMTFFYVNYLYLSPKLLINKEITIFMGLLILGIVAVSLLNWWIHHTFTDPVFMNPNHRQGPPPEMMQNDLGGQRPRRPIMLAGPMFSSFLITIMVASVGTSLVLWRDWEKTREEQQEREFQKVASELAVLKLQISPHFLFNTLNNIRWLVRSKSDNAEVAIVKLSQLLRYMLYQTNHDYVPLTNELEHLLDFINLQQMRLANQNSLDVVCEGDPNGKKIVPLLFIPIIENMFKHGDFDEGAHNLIKIVVKEKGIYVEVENRILQKGENLDKDSGGIGLANVKKRLALHYPEKHLLNFYEKGGIYKLELDIILE